MMNAGALLQQVELAIDGQVCGVSQHSRVLLMTYLNQQDVVMSVTSPLGRIERISGSGAPILVLTFDCELDSPEAAWSAGKLRDFLRSEQKFSPTVFQILQKTPVGEVVAFCRAFDVLAVPDMRKKRPKWKYEDGYQGPRLALSHHYGSGEHPLELLLNRLGQ